MHDKLTYKGSSLFRVGVLHVNRTYRIQSAMTSPSPQVSLIVDDSNNAFFHFDNSTASTNLPLYYLTTLNVAGSPTAAENTTFVEIFFDGEALKVS